MLVAKKVGVSLLPVLRNVNLQASLYMTMHVSSVVTSLMARALGSGLRSLGLNPAWGHYIVFLTDIADTLLYQCPSPSRNLTDSLQNTETDLRGQRDTRAHA